MERAKRIELSSQPWQGRVLPLNHARESGTTKYSIAKIFYSYNFFDTRLAYPCACAVEISDVSSNNIPAIFLR